MPPRLLQETKNQGSFSSSSYIKFPGTGRSSGRVDCILVQMDYTGVISGSPGGVRGSELHVFVDDPDQSSLAKASFSIDFGEAYSWGNEPSVGPIVEDIGGGTNRWTFALYHPFLFRYYFDLWIENPHSSGLDFHTTVFFEEF